MKLKYKDYDVYLTKKPYSNGRACLILNCIHTGQPITKATINIPDINLRDDEVIIKDYSENEGMLDWLIQNEIVDFKTEFEGHPIVRLLI